MINDIMEIEDVKEFDLTPIQKEILTRQLAMIQECNDIEPENVSLKTMFQGAYYAIELPDEKDIKYKLVNTGNYATHFASGTLATVITFIIAHNHTLWSLHGKNLSKDKSVTKIVEQMSGEYHLICDMVLSLYNEDDRGIFVSLTD